MRLLRLLCLFAVTAFVWTGCSSGADPASDDSASAPPDVAAPTYPTAIQVDGAATDWNEVPVRHADPTGDGEALDFDRLWVAHDSERLYLRVEVGSEINLQEGNDLTLHLDTDYDANTGTAVGGIGADLSWTFGERSGRVHANGGRPEIEHEAIGLATLPTVTSSVFEIALDRDATPATAPLFRADSLRVAFSGGGDRIPNEGGLSYAFSATDLPDWPTPRLERPTANGVRVLSYNAERDGFFEDSRTESYTQILNAVQPNIIGFNELYENSAEATRERVESLYGTPDSGTWYVDKKGIDLVMVSQYPILATHAITGYQNYTSGAYLLDTEDALGTPLLVVLAHLPCCNYEDATPSRDVRRQLGVDSIIAFLREAQEGNAPIDVPENTPILITGDMNFVGDAQQPNTLKTGTIVNTDEFGASTAPDWDGTDLLDVNPRQTGTSLHSTWMGRGSSYPPSRLDYAYVSDSVLDVAHAYTLYTPGLPDSVRQAHALDAEATTTASDHLPLVLDLVQR